MEENKLELKIEFQKGNYFAVTDQNGTVFFKCCFWSEAFSKMKQLTEQEPHKYYIQEIYLRHALTNRIEPAAFWVNEMLGWETDIAGNTPEEQFEMVLETVIC